MTAAASEQRPCPCGSGRPFTACCGPYLAGADNPPTAEALMRARYSAHVEGDDGYLARSWHARTRPEDVSAEEDLRWLGLQILQTQGGGSNDTKGTVEFIARFEVRGKPAQLHEVSRFVREDGRWLYLDGESGRGRPARTAKIGRNAPCPCGSGRKYKQCCGR
jgi:SEC-C motif-containing protein